MLFLLDILQRLETVWPQVTYCLAHGTFQYVEPGSSVKAYCSPLESESIQNGRCFYAVFARLQISFVFNELLSILEQRYHQVID